jgi:5-methyltetrahydrofolate--homocysteine methyltransferase
MLPLLYRADIDAVRDRLRAFWGGGDLGRPALLITCPREKLLEPVEENRDPAGWLTEYSTTDYHERLKRAHAAVATRMYFGEAVPTVAPDLAPNCLALYLGCRGVEMPGTVWCQPFIADPDGEDTASYFRYDPENFYWRFSSRLGADQVRMGRGKWLVQFPDLIEGLDTLEAMRGAGRLLLDLYDRPEWVRGCLRRVTDLYFHYYDVLYGLFRDEVGGSVYWAWAPGRMAKFQCDFSAMIGPEMFGELMVPVLREMTERVSYSMYHWDGPGAIPHHDHLLGIPHLDMIQWTPGSGHPPIEDPTWWPLYHKTVDAGKRLFIGGVTMEGLGRLAAEFGPRLRRFLIGMDVRTAAEAEKAIALAER